MPTLNQEFKCLITLLRSLRLLSFGIMRQRPYMSKISERAWCEGGTAMISRSMYWPITLCVGHSQYLL